jgi:hypothetical protein
MEGSGMREEDEDRLIREEEEAAAAEAAQIGGRAGDEDVSPAERPLTEAGGGEAEGFEVAEEDLIDHAEHQEGEGIPRLDQFGAEPERDPSVHGEADEEDSTGVVRDPDVGEDDPGAGPGLTSER